METDTSVVMDAFIGQGDFSAIAAHCESALLDASARAGGGHPLFAAHILSLLVVGRVTAARFVAAQRLRLPPQPVTGCDAAALRVASALCTRERDVKRAHVELDIHEWREGHVRAIAGALANILREQALSRLELAYSRVHASVIANVLVMPQPAAIERSLTRGWAPDDQSDAFMCTPKPNRTQTPRFADPADRIAGLADQLVRMQTSG